MAHIVEFEIEDLAGRTGVYGQKLNRDTNIFFGVNGGGKTSLLKILHSALSKDTTIIAKAPFRRASVTIFSINHNRTYTYEIEKPIPRTVFNEDRQLFLASLKSANLDSETWIQQMPERDKDTEFVWKIKGENKESKTVGRWQHTYLPTSRLLLGNQGYDTSEISEDSLDRIFKDATERIWLNLFGQIQGQVRKVQQDGIASILNQALGGEPTDNDSTSDDLDLDEKVAYDRMMTFLQRQYPNAKKIPRAQFNKKFQNEPLIRSIVSRIDQVESSIEKAMAPRDKLQDLLNRFFSQSKTLQLRETSLGVITSNKKTLDLGSLSSGEKHLLRILLDVIVADESSLIIDEPELSMHIDWQRELIRSMRELNPEAQLIFATHSPEVMADIDDSKIFRL